VSGPSHFESRDAVGPVLAAGPLATAIVGAIRRLNEDVSVVHRGAYVRVLVPNRCVLTRRAVEQETGEPFEFPLALEQVMPSFKGRLSMTDDDAVWEWRGRP
jgi:toluene monooxygenase system protein D